jgi:hypothetical protein
MGPKGSRIQQITKDHNVQIKFPDREDPNGEPPAGKDCYNDEGLSEAGTKEDADHRAAIMWMGTDRNALS